MNEFKVLYDKHMRDIHAINDDQPLLGNIDKGSLEMGVLIGSIVLFVLIYRKL